MEEISVDSISLFFEDFTTEGKDHSAGDKETADYIAEQWKQFGIDKWELRSWFVAVAVATAVSVTGAVIAGAAGAAASIEGFAAVETLQLVFAIVCKCLTL